MHLQGPGDGGTWGIIQKGTEKGTSVSGRSCTDWKEYYKSWFSHLPEYLYSLSWIWQDWQEETFSCALISFLVSQAAGACWLWRRGVHRSQHLHSTMVQQAWIPLQFYLWESNHLSTDGGWFEQQEVQSRPRYCKFQFFRVLFYSTEL